MISPVWKGVVTAPAAGRHKVDVAESLVQLLPGVRVAGQQPHLALPVVEVVVRLVEGRLEVTWREPTSVQAAMLFSEPTRGSSFPIFMIHFLLPKGNFTCMSLLH